MPAAALLCLSLRLLLSLVCCLEQPMFIVLSLVYLNCRNLRSSRACWLIRLDGVPLEQSKACLFACCPTKLTSSLVLSAFGACQIIKLDWRKVAQAACKDDIFNVVLLRIP